jgi:hypothetical protein
MGAFSADYMGESTQTISSTEHPAGFDSRYERSKPLCRMLHFPYWHRINRGFSRKPNELRLNLNYRPTASPSIQLRRNIGKAIGGVKINNGGVERYFAGFYSPPVLALLNRIKPPYLFT